MKRGVLGAAGRGVVLIGLLAATLGLGGCKTGEIDKLQDLNRSLTNRNQELMQEVAGLRNERDILARSMSAKDATIADLEARFNECQSRLTAMGGSLDDLNRRLGNLSFSALDPETDRALQELAAQYPDLIEYDAARGMLRFKSDLTFDSGSAVVREGAKTGLNALANVLKSTAAVQYEVRVIGHTDAQRISAGTAQRHPTNMHLSAHRAIAVRDVLVGAGVTPVKVEIAGRGEFMPVVPNGPRGEAERNRRVEIFLVKATMAPAEGAATTTNAPVTRERPPARQAEPMK